MEINYFMDNKQSQFDQLTTDLYTEKDIDISDMALETNQQQVEQMPAYLFEWCVWDFPQHLLN